MSKILNKAKVELDDLYKNHKCISLRNTFNISCSLEKLYEYEQKYEVGLKPIRIENNDDVYFGCGCCGNLVGCAKITQPQYGSYNKFCMDCGTKNDWSDEE